MPLRQAWINALLALFRQTFSSNWNPQEGSPWLLCDMQDSWRNWASLRVSLCCWCTAVPAQARGAPDPWPALQGSSAKAFEVWGVVWVPGKGSACEREMESKLWLQAGQCHSLSIAMDQGTFPGLHSASLLVPCKSVVGGVAVGKPSLVISSPTLWLSCLFRLKIKCFFRTVTCLLGCICSASTNKIKAPWLGFLCAPTAWIINNSRGKLIVLVPFMCRGIIEWDNKGIQWEHS